MNSFWSRIAVAAAGIPLVLGLVYLGGWWLFTIVALAAFVALHEYWLLARAQRPLAPAGYVGGVLALLGAELSGLEWMLGGVLTTLALAFLLKGISEAKQAATVAISGTFLGAGWIGLGLGFLLLVRGIPHDGRLLTFTVVLAVWAGDTFAYFGGRLLGRHSMAPTTSPKKTWEGFVFGTAATVFVTFIALYKQDVLTIAHSIILGVVLAIAAPLGDLFESLLKRDAGVKDSGSVLGGHGGVLDRLDAFFFAAPAAYFCFAAFGHV
ncbi:MAG TPA: phosphatidate cytidylyltransferase [Gaiellaceae bacterium]|nr:phosphatidate cytidylyltransferase [Gaiellaceae bacterium]